MHIQAQVSDDRKKTALADTNVVIFLCISEEYEQCLYKQTILDIHYTRNHTTRGIYPNMFIIRLISIILNSWAVEVGVAVVAYNSF